MTMQTNMSSPPSELAAKHVRAARALLAWSQKDLAKAAGVATSTVADFERGQRTPVANNAHAIRSALEGAGIQFLANGAVIGPAFPTIAISENHGAPVRWVDAEELSNWANRNDGALSLPTLLSHLIRATQGSVVQLRFPADEGVRYPGWDGHTSTDTGSTYVPPGEAGWEIGSQRSNIAQKATEDYEKRTASPAPLDPANATYVFVTPRHWPKKDEWIKARQEEGVWKDIRVYDANDLVHWIEQTPAVGLWLATRLNKRPAGTRQLEDVWEEWSLATQWPLTEDLVLADRDEDAAEILRWLRSGPSVLSLQSTTTDEAIAFFHATLGMLPEDVAANYLARSLVATDADGARALANAPAPLILLLAEAEPGLAQSLVKHGHYVLQAYDDRPVSRGDVRKLERPSREGIANALIATGIAEPRARALARDSARNLSVLRRLIPSAPGRLPTWALEAPPRALLAALLAGGWNENSEADRARLAELADQPYEDIISTLARFVGDLDKPLRKVGSTWRMASPQDAWFLLAPYLTGADIDRFEAAALTVLGSADPRFEMPADERWLASVKGVHRDYSGLMRHGIGETLILLALWGDQITSVRNAALRVDAIVSKLLQHADPQRWWSLSRDFRLLAEASPNAFLDAIEDSLDQSEPPIRVLFGTDEGGVFGTEHLSDLLWALESLAWSPNLVPRVSLVLARLDAIDDPPGRYANRPARSLRQIHLLWNPQTFATLDQRLSALDYVRKHSSDAAWKLMLGILPQNQDMLSPSSLPRWRDFTVDQVETITYGLIGRGATLTTERLFADVGMNAARWAQLLVRFNDLVPDQEAGLAALEQIEPQLKDKADRAVLWGSLRSLLHQHREFPDAQWSMSTEVLDRLETIYNRFAPTDPLERIAWLFNQTVDLPNPSKEGWQAEQRDVDAARTQAAKVLFAEQSKEGVLALAHLVEVGGYLGKALYDSGLGETDLDALIESAIRSDSQQERNVAHGLIISAFQDLKEPWGERLLAKAKAGSWGDTALLAILRAFPVERWTWDQAADAGTDIETAYWRSTAALWMGEDDNDVAFAMRKLISVYRARHALSLAGRGRKIELPSDLLIELLQEAVRQPFEKSGDPNEATMFQYHVGEILQALDERSDVDSQTLATLEWIYLPVLERSRRPVKVLLKALSEQPALFVEALKAVFKPSEDSGIVEPEPEDPERASGVAHQAYKLLELWDRLPGTREDKTIDRDALENWIKEARSLAKAAGRADIGDSRIGVMLSASPIGADGNWPAEAVRDVIDLFRSKPMINSFCIGKRNRRGVTSRGPLEGGDLERREAAKYRDWAKAISFEHPHTAKALNELADSYEHDAKRHDDEAERRDWE
ncbi:MAG TPA: helix-turn-helix transcriptional regulator [Paraburkholderia sp.]|uniref:helix-turn-helix domain-containing protein n=1 Tax=Paraburkholderia sp. TaxID=1926495 RepID=UPI002ED6BBA8